LAVRGLPEGQRQWSLLSFGNDHAVGKGILFEFFTGAIC
jgi:hypothetical protein